ERSERHRAKLRKRSAAGISISPSPTPSPSPSPFLPSRSPSPLDLPAPLQLEFEQQAQQSHDFAQSNPQSLLLYSPSHPSQSSRPVGDDQRQLLESRLRHTLKQLNGPLPQTASSRQRLESQARSILQLLDDLSPTPCPCPQHRDLAYAPVGAQVGDNSAIMDNNRPNSARVSHAYLPATNHQGSFNTLLRKANLLCQTADAEIYMLIRIDGRFYVYNSVEPTSQVALEPEARDKVINVAVTSG
ncbi:hypothetical protein EJ07DRAFT_44620, partial [Lizonia empirigonia]